MLWAEQSREIVEGIGDAEIMLYFVKTGQTCGFGVPIFETVTGRRIM